MRVPRFRAWVPRDSRMHAVTALNWSGSGVRHINTLEPVNKVYKTYATKTNYVMNGSFELMQSTGLNDNNGVEIYEGDIVRGEYHIFRVAYYGAAFRLKTTDDTSPDLLPILENSERVEVIGNIYENPELVK